MSLPDEQKCYCCAFEDHFRCCCLISDPIMMPVVCCNGYLLVRVNHWWCRRSSHRQLGWRMADESQETSFGTSKGVAGVVSNTRAVGT